MPKKQKNIAVIDFETDPFLFGRPVKPFASGFYDGAQIIIFWGADCVSRLVEFINDLDDEYIIYAHNGGKFDFHFMLNYLDEKIKIINGRIAECYIGQQTLRDSFLILPLALKNHGKTEIDYDKFEEEVREKHKNEITEYLKDDLKYLHSWVTKFIDRFGVRLTLAGTTFNVMKKQFNYHIEKTDSGYDSKFREFYYGGRVECIQSGIIDGPLEYYDITSAYPFAMLSEHPKGDQFIIKKILPKKAGGWFAKIDAISHGCLPIRADKMQYYRDNETRTYYATGWEIFAGLETNTLIIKKIHFVYLHCETRNFKEYVNFFYKEKSAAKECGDTDTETFSKLLLNAAYGKFGQDSREFYDYIIKDFGANEENGFRFECDFGDFELHKRQAKNEDDCEFYNVATAASITGYVRAYIWRAINNSDMPCYCDTDSLLCSRFAGQVGAEIGSWKHEATVNRAFIGGRKFYLLECADGTTKKATKGFRASDDEIRGVIADGEEYTFKKDAPSFSIKYGQRFSERNIKTTNGS